MFFRGGVYWCEFPSEELYSFYRGIRPVIVVSNDKGNYHSSMVTVVPCSSRTRNRFLPTHCCFRIFPDVLEYAHCENVSCVPKSWLKEDALCFLSDVQMRDVDSCLRSALGMEGDD